MVLVGLGSGCSYFFLVTKWTHFLRKTTPASCWMEFRLVSLQLWIMPISKTSCKNSLEPWKQLRVLSHESECGLNKTKVLESFSVVRSSGALLTQLPVWHHRTGQGLCGGDRWDEMVIILISRGIGAQECPDQTWGIEEGGGGNKFFHKPFTMPTAFLIFSVWAVVGVGY